MQIQLTEFLLWSQFIISDKLLLNCKQPSHWCLLLLLLFFFFTFFLVKPSAKNCNFLDINIGPYDLDYFTITVILHSICARFQPFVSKKSIIILQKSIGSIKTVYIFLCQLEFLLHMRLYSAFIPATVFRSMIQSTDGQIGVFLELF